MYLTLPIKPNQDPVLPQIEALHSMVQNPFDLIKEGIQTAILVILVLN